MIAKTGTARGFQGNAGRLTTLCDPKGHLLHRDRFRQAAIRPGRVAASLSETLRTYDLRHSHASLHVDNGASPLAVAQSMGYSDPAMTLRVYGHLFEGVQEDLARRLDELRSATTGQCPEAGMVDMSAGRKAT
jgi:integrase